MLSVDQIKTYNNDGLVKSSTQLSSDKVKDLNLALDKYLEDHKDENNEFVSGLYERDEAFLKYHKNEKFLKKVSKKFGHVALENIKKMTTVKLRRKILE